MWIWNNIPSQLAKENKKFLYQTIKEGARAREYETALNWLNDSNLIYKIYNITKPDFPLKAYNDFSMNNLSKNNKVLNIPLFLIEYMHNFI